MSQFSLKIVALICMLLDHTAYVLLSGGLTIPGLSLQNVILLRTFMGTAGRIAFPIFAWFVAEGCRKTHNPKGYLLRLGVFALLSEIPFQLCVYVSRGRALELGCHNVIFTMLLGALAILLVEWCRKKRLSWLGILPAGAAIALGWILKTDYNAWGVALILGLYFLEEEPSRLLFLGTWMTVFMLIWHGYSGNGVGLSWLWGGNYYLLLRWIGGMMSVPLLATYSGARGRNIKWIFYGFYPTHLLALYGMYVGMQATI